MNILKQIGRVESERVFLRRFIAVDITQRYIDWLNDPEVNRFLSVRGNKQTMETVRDYVTSFEQVDNRLLLGIFDKQSGEHIGNITFSSIEWKNEVGVVGIAVGDKKYWGKGYATEALSLAAKLAFLKLGLHRLEAAVSIKNDPSRKLFEKVGFSQEGRLKDREKQGHEYVDGFIYALINNNKCLN